MKKALFFAAFLFALTSCATLQTSERIVLITGVDFSSYAAKGFLFTPNDYPGKYESMGLINAQIFPEVKKLAIGVKRNNVLYDYYTFYGEDFSVEKLSGTDAIDEIYKAAVKIGGNAIINLQIKNISYPNSTLTIPGWEITGFVIKRLDK